MIRNEAKLIGRLTADPELIPDLDPNHKSQEEYQMIHNALSESEDLPF